MVVRLGAAAENLVEARNIREAGVSQTRIRVDGPHCTVRASDRCWLRRKGHSVRRLYRLTAINRSRSAMAREKTSLEIANRYSVGAMRQTFHDGEVDILTEKANAPVCQDRLATARMSGQQ